MREAFINYSNSSQFIQNGGEGLTYNFKLHTFVNDFTWKENFKLLTIAEDKWKRDHLVHQVKLLANRLMPSKQDKEDLTAYFEYKLLKNTPFKTTQEFIENVNGKSSGSSRQDAFLAYVDKKGLKGLKSPEEKRLAKEEKEAEEAYRNSPQYKIDQANEKIQIKKEELTASLNEVRLAIGNEQNLNDLVTKVNDNCNPVSVNGKQTKTYILNMLECLRAPLRKNNFSSIQISSEWFSNENYKNVLNGRLETDICIIFNALKKTSLILEELKALEPKPAPVKLQKKDIDDNGAAILVDGAKKENKLKAEENSDKPNVAVRFFKWAWKGTKTFFSWVWEGTKSFFSWAWKGISSLFSEKEKLPEGANQKPEIAQKE